MENRRQDMHRADGYAVQALTRQGLAQQQRVARHALAHARVVPGLALHRQCAAPGRDRSRSIPGSRPRSGTGPVRLRAAQPDPDARHQIPRDRAVTEDGLDSGIKLVGRGAIGHGFSRDAERVSGATPTTRPCVGPRIVPHGGAQAVTGFVNAVPYRAAAHRRKGWIPRLVATGAASAPRIHVLTDWPSLAPAVTGGQRHDSPQIRALGEAGNPRVPVLPSPTGPMTATPSRVAGAAGR